MNLIRFAILFVLLLYLMLYGCNRDGSVQENQRTLTAFPSFIETNEEKSCHCIEITAYLARGEMGLSPISIQKSGVKDSDKLKSELKPKITSLHDCLQELQQSKVGPTRMRVLVHEKGHVYGLLGTIEVDGVRFFQLFHGNSQVWLVTSEQLGRAGFVEVWKLEKVRNEVPISVGSGSLVVDRLYHNFGEVRPQSEVVCTFHLRNNGDKTIILSQPETSCSCTVPSLKTATKLEAGQAFSLEIRLITSRTTSTRQTVGMKCFEESTQASQQFTLDLFANQRQSMEVTPGSLDFGIVNPGEEDSRVIVLKEVPTDRFSISKIEVGSLPLKTTIHEMVAVDGMNHYQIDLYFKLMDENIEGKREDFITITTDSRQFPQMKIPVIYEASSSIRAIPSVVSFGTVKVGEKVVSEIEFESRGNGSVEVKVESLPGGVRFEKHGDKYQVQFNAQSAGIWEGVIKLTLKSGNRKVQLSLECAAFVQD
jgi:hypothetical protein